MLSWELFLKKTETITDIIDSLFSQTRANLWANKVLSWVLWSPWVFATTITSIAALKSDGRGVCRSLANGSLSQDLVSHFMWITVAIHSLQVIHPGLREAQVSWISRAEPGEIPGWACRALCNPTPTSGDPSQAACVQEPVTFCQANRDRLDPICHPKCHTGSKETPNCPWTMLAGIVSTPVLKPTRLNCQGSLSS